MTPNKFIGTLFQSRDIIHLAHLDTTSFAEHMALGEYYEGVLDHIDSFTEKYFGANGRIPLDIPASKKEPARDHLKGIAKMVEAEMDNYSPDLQNILQDLLGLVNETLYKLTLM